jgi:hypothetical protein
MSPLPNKDLLLMKVTDSFSVCLFHFFIFLSVFFKGTLPMARRSPTRPHLLKVPNSTKLGTKPLAHWPLQDISDQTIYQVSGQNSDSSNEEPESESQSTIYHL